MSEQEIRQLLTDAADVTAPPSGVTATMVYPTGVRRRLVRRWLVGAALVTAVSVAAGGATVLANQPGPGPRRPGAGGTASATPQSPSPGPSASAATRSPTNRTCMQFAESVMAVLRTSLPADLQWDVPTFVDDTVAGSYVCDNDEGLGGIFWVRFTRAGKQHQLAFEGGTGTSDAGCDPTRQPARCEKIPGGEIGHLANAEEYAVLYGANNITFYLGMSEPGTNQPLTTDQLAAAAREIAHTVFSGP